MAGKALVELAAGVEAAWDALDPGEYLDGQLLANALLEYNKCSSGTNGYGTPQPHETCLAKMNQILVPSSE